jgi:hypothetical protein
MAFMKLGETLGLSPNFQQMNLIRAQLEENEKLYDMYKNKFGEIGKLQDGDKLARDSSGVYYRHEKGIYFIQLRRWWTNQGRAHTFSHLDEDFSQFMKYLDIILRNLEITYEVRYRELAKKLKDLANLLMTGLYTLKKTYPSEKELICKIDSIILSLIDFKTALGEKLTMKIPYITTARERAFSE